MWYLVEQEPTTTPSARYWFGGVGAGGRTIGRKSVDIRLMASSVSRTHATIRVEPASFYTQTAGPVRRRHQSTAVSVEDSSAYGTFLKYPPGHLSNRASQADGHHMRLDKDRPKNVQEGALLSFGAPSLWCRVAWFPLVCFPSRLTEPEKVRLAEVVRISGVEVADVWSPEVTHFVTNECHATSMRFLTALVEEKRIVKLAWVESVAGVVSEACKAVVGGKYDAAAVESTKLPDEKLFEPPFSSLDKQMFLAEDLAYALDDARVTMRKELFLEITFAFVREERRARWAAVLEHLGATTCLAEAIETDDLDELGSTIFVLAEPSSGKARARDQLGVPEGARAVHEKEIIEAILRGSPECVFDAMLDSRCEGIIGAADVPDVATPGPLDVDAGESGESDDSALARRSSIAEEAEALASRRGHNPRASNPEHKDDDTNAGTRREAPTLSYKRSRIEAGLDATDASQPLQADSAYSRMAVRRPRVVGVDGDTVEAPTLEAPAESCVLRRTATAENSSIGQREPEEHHEHDVNARSYFTLAPVDPTLPNSGLGARSAFDVRPFRRKTIPSASKIPLKRAKYLEDGEASAYGGAAASEPRHRRRNAESESD